jgi:hypothetical protein
MSLIRDNKINKMYGSTAMKEARAPAKEISPEGKLKLKHTEELRELGKRQDAEWDRLKWQHQEMINKNILAYRKDTLAPDQQEKKDKDIKAMREKHQKQNSDARTRHRLELDRHFKQHGIAP